MILSTLFYFLNKANTDQIIGSQPAGDLLFLMFQLNYWVLGQFYRKKKICSTKSKGVNLHFCMLVLDTNLETFCSSMASVWLTTHEILIFY